MLATESVASISAMSGLLGAVVERSELPARTVLASVSRRAPAVPSKEMPPPAPKGSASAPATFRVTVESTSVRASRRVEFRAADRPAEVVGGVAGERRPGESQSRVEEVDRPTVASRRVAREGCRVDRRRVVVDPQRPTTEVACLVVVEICLADLEPARRRDGGREADRAAIEGRDVAGQLEPLESHPGILAAEHVEGAALARREAVGQCQVGDLDEQIVGGGVDSQDPVEPCTVERERGAARAAQGKRTGRSRAAGRRA